MWWQVYGTDAGTGQPITLEVEHAQATGAVQVAMSRKILVRHVAVKTRMKSLLRLLAWGSGAILVVTCGMLLSKLGGGGTVREQIREAHARQAGLLASLADAHGTIGGLQQRVEELNAARQRVAATEQELAKMRLQVADLQKAVTTADAVKGDLAAAKEKLTTSQKRLSQLDMQFKEQTQRVKELEGQAAELAKVENTNKELSGEVERLKEQTLAFAIESQAKNGGTPAETEPSDTHAEGGGGAMRWALTTEYDQAMDFMVTHFSHVGAEGGTTVKNSDGTLTTTAVLPSNAATMRLTHDAEKQRVYSATLMLSLASDGPKAKLAENMQLVNAFVKAIAPASSETEAWIAATIKQLSGKDSAERVMRVGTNYKITAWNNQMGVYAWRIESPRGEAE
ncbi:MAG: hypothetical protein FWD61_08400 [Phycisphaerales bacterium]|nr:hypothetical protein [Phycisphaerales bacterium]